MRFFGFFCIFLLVGTVCANGFETRKLPVAICSPVQSEAVVESPSIPPGQILAESGSTIPMTVSPNAIETPEETLVEPDFSAKEAELSEREKAVEEREKAVEKREAALNDWYTKLSEYREYLNGLTPKTQTQTQFVVRPSYQNSYGAYSGYSGGSCVNGQCYGGW